MFSIFRSINRKDRELRTKCAHVLDIRWRTYKDLRNTINTTVQRKYEANIKSYTIVLNNSDKAKFAIFVSLNVTNKWIQGAY